MAIVTITRNPFEIVSADNVAKIFVSSWAETIVTIQTENQLRLVHPSEYLEAKGSAVAAVDGYVNYIDTPMTKTFTGNRCTRVKTNQVRGKVKLWQYAPQKCGSCINAMKGQNWWEQGIYIGPGSSVRKYSDAQLNVEFPERARAVTGVR